jgi:restriction system protein
VLTRLAEPAEAFHFVRPVARGSIRSFSPRVLVPIPDFQTIMPVLMEHLADGADHANQETLDTLADHFGLTEAERAQLLPSGRQELFKNRVAWAKTHLKQARLIESPKRGIYRISPRGRDVLRRRDGPINMRFLAQFPEYQAFRSRSQSDEAEPGMPAPSAELTAQEQIDFGYQQLRNELAADILQRIKECPPEFFERLVIELLLAMGYGGSRADAGRAVGRSGDGGIDGIIKEDRLGLDTIYIQAKRWDGKISRPEVQKFAGALQGQRARKGIFITTAEFTKEAEVFASVIDSKIVLINGGELASLMIDHGIGVSTVATYELKRLDVDYFAGE